MLNQLGHFAYKVVVDHPQARPETVLWVAVPIDYELLKIPQHRGAQRARQVLIERVLLLPLYGYLGK